MYANGSPPATKKTGGSSSRNKRKKSSYQWNARERAGMSFMIVIAFFAVFGLIILTEVLMIDDRTRGGSMMVRPASMNNRFGESIPDYEETKDDYDDNGIFVRENHVDGSLLKSTVKNKKFPNKAGHDQKLNIGIPVITDQDTKGAAAIPWGQILPPRIEQTLPPYPADMKPTDGSWQVVNGTRFKFFVFSAFFDRRTGKFVRVIGATKTRGPERVWCRFWYTNSSNDTTKYHSASVMARVKVIRENWNLKYSACFVLCPIKGSNVEVPQFVSIVSKIRAPPGNVLVLRNTDTDPDYGNRSISEVPNKIAVCVKPLHFNYDQALYLLEFLELNSLLGVSHFTFYNHTIGPKASCVLKHYIDGDLPYKYSSTGHLVNVSTTTASPLIGQIDSNNIDSMLADTMTTSASDSVRPQISVTILPWNLKMRSQKEIRTEGLFASLNDCLYRSMYRYSHIALIDLDEFIIPRHNETLTDLLNVYTQRVTNRNTGAYSFQNAFFYLQFQDDESMFKIRDTDSVLKASLVTQRKTRRRSKLHPQKQRSKYICKPEAVIEAGNHFVWEFIPGRGSLNVPADSAILHHYRVCEFGGDDCIKAPSLVDRTAHKYSKKLIGRVNTVFNYLKDRCDLPDLPPPPTKPPPSRKRKMQVVKQMVKEKQSALSQENVSSFIKTAILAKTNQNHNNQNSQN